MTLLADRYELAEELGSGGMGRVVVAHDRLLHRDVAVKLLSPSADEVARERFIREARSAAQLHHPNVVGVYDTGETDGQPYLVMELVRGRSLADVLEERGRLDIEEAIGITVGVLDGLAAAHRAGMIHRDVKPGNVLLPDDGGVKLSDFGIAKALGDVDTNLTATGSLMGTPTYLAPELVGGEAPSPASDVYGVGCLLYAQLSGEPPFTQGEALAIAYAHRNEPVPPVETLRADVPDEVATVVARALEKDPARRYPDAISMRTALLEGPEAVPPTGAATVAMAGAPAASDRTQLLHGSDDEATRAIGAAAPPPAAPPPAPAKGPRRRRRWWIPLLVAALLLLLALLLWPLLADVLDGGEAPESEETDEPVVEEPLDDDADEEPEEPEDEDPEETPDETPEDEAPEDEPTIEVPEDTPPPVDPPGQDQQTDDGAATGGPGDEEPGSADGGDPTDDGSA